MTNQKFRQEAKELLGKISKWPWEHTNHEYREDVTSEDNWLVATILNSDMGSEHDYNFIAAAPSLIDQYEQTLSECECKLNEAIEVIKELVAMIPDFKVAPNDDHTDPAFNKASKLMEHAMNKTKIKAREFLNKVGK